MKKNTILCRILAVLMMLSVTVSASAVTDYEMEYKPGTADTVTNLPEMDSGKGGEAYTVSPQVPERKGYEFRDWTLDYGIAYKVTYVVNPDPKFGTPEDSKVPVDPTRYAPNEMVKVHDQLTTEVGYAYNEKDEKVKGTWEFVTWDKADFEITEDTTITGGWIFDPAPVKKYHYTVEYWLVDGTKLVAEVADKKYGTVDALGNDVTEEAIPMGSKLLYAKYRSPKKYQIKQNWKTVTATIFKDNQVIYIFYEPVQHGQ